MPKGFLSETFFSKSFMNDLVLNPKELCGILNTDLCHKMIRELHRLRQRNTKIVVKHIAQFIISLSYNASTSSFRGSIFSTGQKACQEILGKKCGPGKKSYSPQTRETVYLTQITRKNRKPFPRNAKTMTTSSHHCATP